MTLTLDELMPHASAPELDPILAYRGVHALCTVAKDGRVLKATHYASVMISGRSPLWAVFTVRGRFLRFYASRTQIEHAYPRLAWRRKMATYQLCDITDKSVESRRAELESVYGARVPELETA